MGTLRPRGARRRQLSTCLRPGLVAWMIAVLIPAGGCDRASRSSPGEAAAAGEGAVFEEVASGVGLDFVYRNGAVGDLLLAEIMGSGAALVDYDRDGDLDVLLLQGAPFAPGSDEDAAAWTGRLYRNELLDASGRRSELRFTDVTETSGLEVHGHAMGVAVGDVDNDGWPDFYLTFLGPNQLWRNRGDGSFELAAVHGAGEPPRWSTAASFFDYDRDGWLDLYVVEYLVYSPASDPPCTDISGRPDYCRPTEFPPAGDRLFHNRGDGTFEEATADAGIGRPGAGLGSIALDADDDGWLDLYVANDGEPNFLWRNRHDGTFEEIAVQAGAAVNGDGAPEASMGLGLGDYDGDGDEDLFITHLALETSTLYRRIGPGLFEDATAQSGLEQPTWKWTGFGTAWLDYDLDGRLDLVAVNGGVENVPDVTAMFDTKPLAMPNQLFHNRGDGRLMEVSELAGGGLEEREVSRALALGDVDDDGDADALVTNNDGPVRLLLNRIGDHRRWLGVRLVEAREGRDALGAKVDLVRADGSSAIQWVRTDGSYLAASDPRRIFGLGEGPAVRELRVTWVGGEEEVFEVEEGRYQTLVRGSGRPADPGVEEAPRTGDRPLGENREGGL